MTSRASAVPSLTPVPGGPRHKVPTSPGGDASYTQAGGCQSTGSAGETHMSLPATVYQSLSHDETPNQYVLDA